MAKKKLYVVTRGEYSDYRVVAIFDDKKMAEWFATMVQQVNDIEEYELNPHAEAVREGFGFYRVEMGRNGDVLTATEDTIGWSYIPPPSVRAERWNHAEKKPAGELILIVFTFARDAKHAIKIANEQRAQIIASNNWTHGYTMR